MYVQQGKLTEARNSYQEACRWASDGESAEEARLMVVKIDARTLYDSGCKREAAGDWDKAFSAYDAAVRLKPDFAEAIYGRGTMSHRKGDLDAAWSDYNHAISLKSDLAEAYDNRGALKEVRGDWDGALSDFTKAIELKPVLGEAYVNRGQAKLHADDFEGARADFSRAFESQPQLKLAVSTCFHLLGCAEYDRHRFSECVSDFQQALDLDPWNDWSNLRIWLARSMLGQSATLDLQKYLTRRHALKPDDWPSAIGRFLIGELTEQELLQKSSSVDENVDASQRCEAYFYAGAKLSVRGDEGSARSYFEKAIATGAKNVAEYQSAQQGLARLK